MVAEQWAHAYLFRCNLWLEYQCEKSRCTLHIADIITVMLGRWGASRHKHSSHEQVSEEENWFDIIFWEVAHIPRLIPPACCVYFQTSRDGGDSCSMALESQRRSLCHRRRLLLGCLSFVCTLKWWNRPEIYFLPGFDLIFSDIWALICSSLGCFRYKLDIMDFRACVLCFCVTVEGNTEQTQTLQGAIHMFLAAT